MLVHFDLRHELFPYVPESAESRLRRGCHHWKCSSVEWSYIRLNGVGESVWKLGSGLKGNGTWVHLKRHTTSRENIEAIVQNLSFFWWSLEQILNVIGPEKWNQSERRGVFPFCEEWHGSLLVALHCRSTISDNSCAHCCCYACSPYWQNIPLSLESATRSVCLAPRKCKPYSCQKGKTQLSLWSFHSDTRVLSISSLELACSCKNDWWTDLVARKSIWRDFGVHSKRLRVVFVGNRFVSCSCFLMACESCWDSAWLWLCKNGPDSPPSRSTGILELTGGEAVMTATKMA